MRRLNHCRIIKSCWRCCRRGWKEGGFILYFVTKISNNALCIYGCKFYSKISI